MQGNNKFKTILLAVFGFLFLVGLIAFSTFKAGPSSNTPTVNVSIWGTVDKNIFNNFIALLKTNQNLILKLTYTQKSIDTIDNDILEAIATGKAPDTILIPQELMKRYLDKVNLISYATIPQRTFKDTFIQEAEIYFQPNGIFALPFFVDPLVMYWNRDIFSSAGIANPPTKWSEFQLLAPKISRSDANANITQSIASLGEYRNIDNAKGLLSTLIMQAGSPIVALDSAGYIHSYLSANASATSTIPTESALRFFVDFSNPKKSIYSWNRSLPSSKNFFLSGNLATYFGYASEANDLRLKNPNLNFDVTMMPQTVDATSKTTFGEIYGFAFLKSSPNFVAAYTLVNQLLASNVNSVFLNLTNFAPSRRNLISAGTTDPAKSVFYNSALIAKGWIDPDANATNQIFQNMVEDITTGRSDITTSVQKASNSLNSLI